MTISSMELSNRCVDLANTGAEIKQYPNMWIEKSKVEYAIDSLNNETTGKQQTQHKCEKRRSRLQIIKSQQWNCTLFRFT